MLNMMQTYALNSMCVATFSIGRFLLSLLCLLHSNKVLTWTLAWLHHTPHGAKAVAQCLFQHICVEICSEHANKHMRALLLMCFGRWLAVFFMHALIWEAGHPYHSAPITLKLHSMGVGHGMWGSGLLTMCVETGFSPCIHVTGVEGQATNHVVDCLHDVDV
jgi:hypothetical protein